MAFGKLVKSLGRLRLGRPRLGRFRIGRGRLGRDRFRHPPSGQAFPGQAVSAQEAQDQDESAKAPRAQEDAGDDGAGERGPKKGRHRRRPTDSSYYDFGDTPSGKPGSATWMYARDVRAQQAGVPEPHADRRYPSYYGNMNRDAFDLSSDAEDVPIPSSKGKSRVRKGWLHHVLVPGRQKTFDSNVEKNPGKIRSVYPPSDRSKFDVIYHASGKRGGDFKKAKYVGAADKEAQVPKSSGKHV